MLFKTKENKRLEQKNHCLMMIKGASFFFGIESGKVKRKKKDNPAVKGNKRNIKGKTPIKKHNLSISRTIDVYRIEQYI